MDNRSSELGPRYRIFRASTLALDYVFPPVCLGCGEIGEHWCQSCEDSLVPLPENNCDICGIYVEDHGLCTRCSGERPFYDSSASLGIYRTELAHALVTLKYQKNLAIGIYYVARLSEILIGQGWQIDFIVPLPLAKERLLERGYNQVEIFSKVLSIYSGIAHGNTWLRRSKNTNKQVGLSIEERKANMLNAFSAEAGLIEGKSILLMDDVMTTGASVNSASKELKRVGAKSVHVLSIARALSIADHDVLLNNQSLLEA